MLQSMLQSVQYWQSYVHLDSMVFIRDYDFSTVHPLASDLPQPIRAVEACK
jgi:hypothetical protein